MNEAFKLPSKSVALLTNPEKLTQKLSELVGKEFKITGKTRTDDSNIRKLIAATLEKSVLPEAAEKESYEIVPPKGRGVPKITREFIAQIEKDLNERPRKRLGFQSPLEVSNKKIAFRT